MFNYGILTVLYMLEHYEKVENYEECKIIIDSIEELEKKHNTTIFKRVSSEVISNVIETYKKFNLTGKNAVENSKYLAEKIIKENEKKEIQQAN